MKKFALIFFALCVSGCTSIPLGTMLEFRSFGVDDLASIEPTEVRAKIQVEEPIRAKIDETKLTFTIHDERGTRAFNYPLILVEERQIEPASRFFMRSAGKTEYTLKLSEQAIENLAATTEAIQNLESGSIHFSVNTNFEEFPSDITEIRLSIFLKLFEEKGFMTLFDNAKIEVTNHIE